MRRDELLKKLKDGVQAVLESERYRDFLRVASRFYNYSFGNQILIWSQKPDATRVAGYNAWKKLGRYVKEGEKGITIMAPVRYREVDEDGVEVWRLRSFKPATVFDISQTEGDPLPQIARRLEGESETAFAMLKRLESAAASMGIAVDYVHSEHLRGANGVYNVMAKRITMDSTLSPDMKAKTLAHELAHAVLHSFEEQEVPREVQETEAESVAFCVAHHFGLDTSSFSFDYIASWAGKSELVLQSGARIQRAVRAILSEEAEEAEAA